MLDLPKVTLVCLSGKDYDKHENAINYSCKGINFGGVKIILDKGIKTIDDWNYKIVYELWNYVDTDYALLIHPDGFVVNPDAWDWNWLSYDYIGAPWPMPSDSYSYRDSKGKIVRVGNSVSLRSKRMMLYPKLYDFKWGSYYGNTNEDGFLTCHNRIKLEELGCKFAPLEVAKWFSRELDIPENMEVDKPFAFHLHDTMKGRNKEFEYLII